MGHGRRLFRTALTLAAALCALVGVQFAVSASAQASERSSGGTTVRTTINLPALVLDNLCNADVVNLHGDLHIVTTTTPARNGGYTVRSTAIARDLRGTRLAPPPAIGYHGDDSENLYVSANAASTRWKYSPRLPDQGATAPSSIDRSGLGTTRSGSTS